MIHGARLAGLAARARVPAMYGTKEFVEAGGLISYSADRTLKGARPAQIE